VTLPQGIRDVESATICFRKRPAIALCSPGERDVLTRLGCRIPEMSETEVGEHLTGFLSGYERVVH
jgi:hypothetical protein